MVFKIDSYQINLSVTTQKYGAPEPVECTSEFLTHMAINWFQSAEYCQSEGWENLFEATKKEFKEICDAQETAERMKNK